jgi:hypothetical protein
MRNKLLRFAMQAPLMWLVLHGTALRVFGTPFGEGMTADQFIKVLVVSIVVGVSYDFGETLR